MKKMTKISVAIISLAGLLNLANAATPGTYVGAGLGYSRLETPNQNIVSEPVPAGVTQSHNRGGLGGRLFVGYNFNKYFGVEGGYTQYARSLYKASLGSDSVSLTYRDSNVFSIVGKAYLPIEDSGFNVYALAGIANVKQTATVKINGTLGADTESESQSKIRPMYGIGGSYDINPHVTTSLEISRVQGFGNMKTSGNAFANADLISLNLAYNFG